MSDIRILLISADHALITPVRECLVQAGYQVVHTSHGTGSLELIQAKKPALIVLDSRLPDFNSLAIIRSIRSNDAYDRLPLIMIGSDMHEEDAVLGLEVGADLCLLESFHPQVFIARVRSLLRRRELAYAPRR